MRITTLALLGLTLVACRDSGSDDDNPGNPDASTQPDAPKADLRVQDVQSDSMPDGTAVTLKGVVVTAVDTFGTRTGEFFVQDPAGGAFSGIKIFNAPLDQVSALIPGDVIDITGAIKKEFAINGDNSGRAVTELVPASPGSMLLTKTGTAPVPAPAIVDAVAVATLDKAAREAEWEKWEGVLITVNNARQIAPARSFGGGGPDRNEFRITGVARVQSALTDLFAENAFGVCYERITGLGDYAFNDLILPRSAADVVAGGAGCRPLASSVAQVQGGTNTEAVTLTNVYVTARDDLGNSKGYWVADSLTAAANNGVYVFTGSSLPADVQVGATVSLQGTIDEFDNAPPGDTLTEVIPVGTPTVTPGANTPIPIVVSPSVLSDLGPAGEAYEGVLAQVATVKVTAALANGKYELTANGGAKIVIDDESFAYPQNQAPAIGTCYASVTGVMHLQVQDNIRTLNPRALTDLVAGTGCE